MYEEEEKDYGEEYEEEKEYGEEYEEEEKEYEEEKEEEEAQEFKLFEEGEEEEGVGEEEEERPRQIDYEALSRIGGARLKGAGETDFSTIIQGTGPLAQLQQKLEKKTRTPEQIFNMSVYDVIKKHNINEYIKNEVISLSPRINRLKFINVPALVFAYLTLNTNKKIDITLLNQIWEKYAKGENISKADLIRYGVFIEKVI